MMDFRHLTSFEGESLFVSKAVTRNPCRLRAYEIYICNVCEPNCLHHVNIFLHFHGGFDKPAQTFSIAMAGKLRLFVLDQAFL
jgi:hypothetical protein